MDNQQVTKTDLAWLAGFTDGEGTIGVTLQSTAKVKNKPWRHPFYSVCSVNGHAIERVVTLCRALGVEPCITERAPRLRQRTTCWYAQVQSFKGTYVMLNALLPYLTVKAPHARLVLQFIESRMAKGTALGKRSGAYSDDELALVQEIALLNGRHGNPTDYTSPAQTREEIVGASAETLKSAAEMTAPLVT